MPDTDLRKVSLPGRYAILLGPLVGAAVGCSGFLRLDTKDALVMVGLFALIGLGAGLMLFAYDRKRRSVG